MRHLLFLASLCLLSLTTLPAFAQESSALINRELDQPVELKLDDTLEAAMRKITEKTGVRLKEDPAVWDLLPWGRETNVKAKFENVTLRQALEAITQKLGLTLVLRDEFVEIQPMPALKRLAQRASRDELRALDLLATQRLDLKTDRPTIRQLLEEVDLKLAEVKDIEVAIENRIGDAVRQDLTVFIPRNATLMTALESLAKETKATWYPWGRNIVIVTKEDRTRRLLGKRLTIRSGARGLDVLQLLLEVARRTELAFEFQPGVIQALPLEAQVLRGAAGQAPVLEDVPAQQILEAISAATGLQYAIVDEKVHISAAQPPAGQGGRREPMLGLLQLDNGMQVMVPVSAVPDDLRQYIQHKTQQQLMKIRTMMQEEGFTPIPPATRPATSANEDL